MASFSNTKAGALLTSGVLVTIRILKYLANHTVSNLTFSGTSSGNKGAKAFTKTISGVLSMAGTYSKKIYDPIRLQLGTLSLSGIVNNTKIRIRKLTFAGIVLYVSSRNLISGTLSLSGSVLKKIGKSAIGYLSFIGTSTGQKMGSGTTYLCSGIVSFAGGIIDVLISNEYTHWVGVHIDFVGTLRRRAVRWRTKSGTLTLTKYLTFSRPGYVQLNYYRTYAGILNFAGNFIKSLNISRVKSGLLTFTGTISKWSFSIAARTKSGTITPHGIISGIYRAAGGGLDMGLNRVGILRLVGLLVPSKSMERAKTSGVSFSGRIRAFKVVEVLYLGVPNY